jgi:hypothetical protein
MTFTDAWTGEPIEGKAIILATTDGPSDFVAPGTLYPSLASLTARVEALEAMFTDPGPETDPEDDGASLIVPPTVG